MAWSDGGAHGVRAQAPHELLDDGFAPDSCDLLVIGCGNILRGDDAVGPIAIRHLFERGLPDGVRLIDGGTSGMDVAFAMRGAARVVIIDASATGAAPGTMYRVPADQLPEPTLDGVHSHNFRWDHALSLSSWLLGPARPTDITVLLVEGSTYEPGAPLSPKVDAAMHSLCDLLEREFFPSSSPTVEITEAGYLHLPAQLATEHFPTDVLLARRAGNELVLMPVISADNGGLVLKQRNAAGDRSLLINEVLHFEVLSGHFRAHWDHDRAALIVQLESSGDTT